MGDTQVNVFIGATTPLTIKQVEGVGTVLVRKDDEPGTALFLANDKPGKAGALTVLARLTAAVEALPDDTHAGQGVLTTEPECDGLCVDSSDIGVPGYGIAYAHPGCPLHDTPGRKCECGTPDRCLSPTHDPAPVWRTLTFGDLRAGDVIKSDENGDEETVRASWPDRVPGYWWYRGSKTCGAPHNTDPVLVRHPRPEVGQ